MDSFIFSLFISVFGLGYLMYGKKAQRTEFFISGVVLMVYPYFVSNLPGMIAIALLFLGLPFVWRRIG
ncbi:MAG: hypothetical protein Kow00108_19760 [Calditrichia bacterium]